MIRILFMLVFAAMLNACGDEPASGGGEKAAPAAPASAPAAPAASAPDTSAASAGDEEEEFTYDPIDTAKLENSWWQQYSAGS